MIQSFRDLLVWQKSMELTVRIYQVTETFPRAEMFGLTSQMRRASTSIPSNIAEGKAIGLGEADAKELLTTTSEVGRMLVVLARSLPRQ
jgi:hypothetical protein